MALIELAIAEAVASGTAWFGMKKAEERANVQASRSAETSRERFISGVVVKVARATVNRKSFQHMVEGVVNHNSGLRQRFPFLQKLGSQERC